MANIRTFKIRNAIGELWNLNDITSFFEDIGNLGFEYDTDFENVGNIFLQVDESLKQPKPNGTINFDSYILYNQFIKFIQKKPLTLVYEMPGVTDVYYLPVKISKIDKEELKDGCLQCDIDFIGTGFFYRSIIVQNEASAAVGKTYDYTYDYTYSESASGTVTIESDTYLDSPCKIQILGPCINPSWVHYVNDVVEITGRVNCTVGSSERLVIDTSTSPYSIKKLDAFMQEIADCYQDSDFTTKRFVNLKNGENKIAFSHEGSTDLIAIIEAKLIYESV